MSTNNFNKFLLVSIGFIAAFLLFSLDVNAAIIHKPPTNLGLVGYWSFNEGAGTLATDFSGNGNTGTLTNGPFWVAGKRGKALSFDGSNDYVIVSDSDSLDTPNALTVAAWIYDSNDGTQGHTINKDTSSGNRNWIVRRDTNTVGNYHVWNSGGTLRQLTPAGSWKINEWFHMSFVVSVSGSTINLRVFINGVSVGTDSFAGTAIQTGTSPLHMGKDFATGTLVKRQRLDEVRIYNRALTLSEVEGLYKSGAVAHKNPSNLGLVGYWSFNEGTSTQAGDSSGNNNGGQLTNGPFWVAGKRGKALSFDGSNDYVDVPDANSIEPSSAITVSVWVKSKILTQDSYDAVLTKRYATDLNPWNSYIFDTTSSGNAQEFCISNGTTDSQTCASTGAGSLTTSWEHWVGVYNGSNIFLYVNAVLQASASKSGAIGYSNLNLTIGTALDAVGRYFNGLIDEVRIYNRALSADEIKILYQGSKYATVNASQNTKLTNGLVGFWSFNGPDVNLTHPTSPKAFDRSGQGNDGILTNGPVAAIGKIGQALNFDGSDDYVDMGDLSAIESVSRITIAAWAKPRTLISTGGVFSKTSATAQAFDMLVGAAGLGDTDDVFVRISNGSASEYGYTSSNILSLGTWGYWVLVFDGTLTGNDRLSFYFNGVKQSLTYGATPPSLSGSNTQNANIGRYPAGGAFFNGLIDEVRIYNRALSADEIKRLYNMGR